MPDDPEISLRNKINHHHTLVYVTPESPCLQLQKRLTGMGSENLFRTTLCEAI